MKKMTTMKTTTILLLGLLIVSILSVGAFAYGGFGMMGGYGAANQEAYNADIASALHQDMYNIMSNGTYNDLVKYREAVDYNIMPMVQNEDDFKLMQQMHSRMSQFRQTGDFENSAGAGIGFGRGGCPMGGSKFI